jgi:hypothetical protein
MATVSYSYKDVQFAVDNLLQYTWEICFFQIFIFLRDSQHMLRDKDL